jgi:hypothetical protein
MEATMTGPSIRHRLIASIIVVALCVAGGSSAWAFVVSDAATTARNAITAVLKSHIVETLTAQYERLQRMAIRLSALQRYATANPPTWQRADEADGFLRALNHGDATGTEYERIARARQLADPELERLDAAARDAIERALATLDLADSTLIAAVHQTGVLRERGARERQTIDQLEADVLNASPQHGTTAVLDTISGAALIEAHQKQARSQFLTAVVEQLLVDNKRSRDTEAATLNMQLNRLRMRSDADEGSDALVTGAAEDLRTWRQP